MLLLLSERTEEKGGSRLTETKTPPWAPLGTLLRRRYVSLPTPASSELYSGLRDDYFKRLRFLHPTGGHRPLTVFCF